MKKEKDVFQPNSGISYSMLTVFLCGLLVGIILLEIGHNYISGEEIILSTIDIINLVLAATLSVASIVLSVTAIILSKITEKSVIELVNDGKDLQHQLFSKNQEILSKLESSSGITEKRVDDIARAIAVVPRSSKDSEDEIRRIIRQNFSGTSLSAEESINQLERLTRKKEKEEFDKNVLIKVSNIDNVKVQKMGDGSFNGVGHDLADLVAEQNGVNFSVSTFYVSENQTAISRYGKETLSSYFHNVAAALGKDIFAHSFFVFNCPVLEQSDFQEFLKEMSSILSEKILERVHFLSGNPDKIADQIESILTA